LRPTDLRQKDLLSIFGTESIVSEVLHQKRPLTVNHIVKLRQRFNLSPAVFFAERKIVPPKQTVLKAHAHHARYTRRGR
jgi:HTH-type transcriptional regulator/antitoxin HigA